MNQQNESGYRYLGVAAQRVVALVLMCFCTTVPGAEMDEQGRIVLTPEEKARCDNEGGCMLISQKQIIDIAMRLGQCKRDTVMREKPKSGQ